MERNKTCCFTGYRSEKLPWGYREQDEACREYKGQIYEAVLQAYHSGKRHFICGMALGSDTYFCEAVLAARITFSDITVEAAVPCEGQADRWNARDKMRYVNLLEQCNVVTLCQQHYDRWCMFRRNIYMVEHSSLVIAGYDGRYGGTHNTVEYAKKKGVAIHIVSPRPT